MNQANNGDWGRSASYSVDEVNMGKEFGRMDRNGQPYQCHKSFGFAMFLYISVMVGGWLDAERTGVGRWHFRSVTYDYVYSNNWCAAGEYTWTAPVGGNNSEGFALLYISVVVAVNQAQALRSPGSGTDTWTVYGNIVSSWANDKSYGFAYFYDISVELGSRGEIRWTVGGRSVNSSG